MILGGFSPLGDSVTSSSSSVVDDIEEKLINWKREVGVRSGSKSDVFTVSQNQWREYFMGKGDELENAAFLALWLSRYVFITKCSCVIRPCVFSMAARLSRGVKIALAPAILAIIYRGLRLLKEKLVHCSDYPFDVNVLVLVAPLHLVQLWAWERFPRLAPIPRMLTIGEPRLARWEGVRIRYKGLKTELDLAGETFRWRPYPSFSDDVGKWVSVDSDENSKWELFVVCLRVCELEGFDFENAENYNPHRVAKQFGFDQDIPCSFPSSSNETCISNLNQLITMTKLYVPSRSFQGEFTLRYADWWKGKNFLDEHDPICCVYTRRKLIRSRTLSLKTLCLLSSPPVECKMLENGNTGSADFENEDLSKKMEQEPDKLLQIACGDLPALVKGKVNDVIVIIDDDEGEGEEGGTVGVFERLVLDIEKRISKLEKAVCDYQQMQSSKGFLQL
ncbi:uncharacterized protein LOC141645847 isoform X2 [Silene latifolia]